MGAFPSLPLFTDAYIADTTHLTNEQHGAYLRLMMFAWRAPDCRLPDDDAKLARMLNLTGARWAKLKPEVMAFWTLADGWWTQKRLRREHDFVSEKVAKKRAAGSQGGRPKSLKTNSQSESSGSENGKQNQSKPKAPTPTPTDIPSETTSLQDASAEKPADPSPALSLKDRLWLEGKPLLVSMGVPEAKAGSMIGRWLRDTEGDPGRVLWAIEESRRQATGDPIPYVTRLLNNSPVAPRGRPNAAPSKDGITSLLADLDRRAHERDLNGRRPGGDGTDPRHGPTDGAHPERRRGSAAGPILDLEPIRSDRR